MRVHRGDPSTKCSSRTNCDPSAGAAPTGSPSTPQRSAARERTATSRRSSRPAPRLCALNEVQLANELRPALMRRSLRTRPAPPSTKCSSRTNCDALDAGRGCRVGDPSTKCSSRTNCDVDLGMQVYEGGSPPQRSAARERTATAATGGPPLGSMSSLNEVQLANELRPRSSTCASFCVCVPQRSAARERTATGVTCSRANPSARPQRSAARERTATPRVRENLHPRVTRPSTKCSSRTNCDVGGEVGELGGGVLPSTKCSSRTNCDRPGPPRRPAAALPGSLNEVQLANELRRSTPARAAALSRTPLNEVQLANELRPEGISPFIRSHVDPQRSAARERTATWYSALTADNPQVGPQRSAARERTATFAVKDAPETTEP